MAATLAASSMATVLYSTEELSISEQRLRADLAHESAVEWVIHDILANGSRSPWIGDGVVIQEVKIAERLVSVSVQQTTGLVDPVTSDPQVLNRLLKRLTQVPSSQSSSVERSAISIRPATYADLQAMLGLDQEGFACLYPHVTLYSGRAEPEGRYASSYLADLLGLTSDSLGGRSILTDSPAHTVVGRTFRVNARSSSEQGATAGLSVEVTITGQIDPSHLVRSRQRIAATADKAMKCGGPT
ncbi:MAG: hypothetical protein JSR42_13410 [Proteobacteria bacterium]|nr:hypothetical protein [Pseudomonadota bacterium]